MASSRRGSVASDLPSTTYKPCAYATDYGSHNVSGPCPRCLAGGDMPLEAMLGMVKAVVRAAVVEDKSESSSISATTKRSECESAGGYADDETILANDSGVPDLGFLGELEAEDRGRLQCDHVGRQVAADLNLRWRAYTRALDQSTRAGRSASK
ncbi:hypothetical protein Q7P37_002197 [Cladosporium fusiforme]